MDEVTQSLWKVFKAFLQIRCVITQKAPLLSFRWVGRHGHPSTVKKALGINQKKKDKKKREREKNNEKTIKFICVKDKEGLVLWTFFKVETESFEKSKNVAEDHIFTRRATFAPKFAPRSPRARPMTSYPDTLRQALYSASSAKTSAVLRSRTCCRRLSSFELLCLTMWPSKICIDFLLRPAGSDPQVFCQKILFWKLVFPCSPCASPISAPNRGAVLNSRCVHCQWWREWWRRLLSGEFFLQNLQPRHRYKFQRRWFWGSSVGSVRRALFRAFLQSRGTVFEAFLELPLRRRNWWIARFCPWCSFWGS